MAALAELAPDQWPPPAASLYCVLRTTGPKTVPLMRSLQEAGIGAWTPVQHISKRRPRTQERQEMLVAFTPTYVFVPAECLEDLRRIEQADVSPHPRFSIFRFYGGTVFVGSRSIAGLMHAEAESRHARERELAAKLWRQRRGERKPVGEAYAKGDVIRPSTGPFTGMDGIVQESDGRHTLVMFGMAMEVTIDTAALRAVTVE